jgi:hypothetical protein
MLAGGVQSRPQDIGDYGSTLPSSSDSSPSQYSNTSTRKRKVRSPRPTTKEGRENRKKQKLQRWKELKEKVCDNFFFRWLVTTLVIALIDKLTRFGC